MTFFMFTGATFTAFAVEAPKAEKPKEELNVLEGVSYTPLVKLPLGEKGAELSSWTLSTYLSGMLRLIIALGGAIAVLMAIIGGVQYVASGIAPAAKNDAKNRITNAFIGLAIILTSYLLLNTINPDLVNFKLALPEVKVEVTPQAVSACYYFKVGDGSPAQGGVYPFSSLGDCESGRRDQQKYNQGKSISACTGGKQGSLECNRIPSTRACGPNLSPITDPDAILMDSGLKVVWTSSNSNVQSNLNKLRKETGDFTEYIARLDPPGVVTVNSTYRPLAYQAHLYEVFKRWNEIKDNTNPECMTLKEKIRREYQKHELGGAVSSPDGCAPHVKGTGVDLTVTGTTFFPNNTELASKGIEISWQNVPNDPWHYNLVNPPFSGCVK